MLPWSLLYEYGCLSLINANRASIQRVRITFLAELSVDDIVDPLYVVVNLVRAALWAIVELNLWVVVASIPALRPLVTRTFRDYKEWKSRSQTKSRHTFGPGFFRGTKGRVWPSNGGAYLSARKRAPLTLNGDQTDVAGSFSFSSVHVHDYNVKISAGNRNPRESGRTLLAINDDGKASGIRIDREITVSQLPKV